MPVLNLLYAKEYAINDKVKVAIPPVGEILENEDEYYSLVTLFTAMPIDLMVTLDDMGIDFTQINDYELFLLLSASLSERNTELILPGLDFSKFILAQNENTQLPVLYDQENDILIDRLIHGKIAAVLRKIHHLKKDIRKPGNDAAKKYLIERARTKAKRKANRVTDSQLEPLIVSLVNTPEFKYNYEEVRDLTIYQFNSSLHQVNKKIEYNNIMRGIYAGMVDAKGIKKELLSWIATQEKE